VVLTVALALIQGPVRALAELYASRFELQGLSLADTGLLLGGGALLGWGGAWLAAARHLAAIEPS
jgi:cell division transport system permease protein